MAAILLFVQSGLGRFIGVLIASLALVSVGAVVEHRHDVKHYQPIIDKANAANVSLQAEIKAQNQAIDDLNAAAKVRADAASVAIAIAQRQVVIAQTKAKQILAHRPPVGSDVCKAAVDDFDQELAEERKQ